MLWVIFQLVSIVHFKYCCFQRLGSGLDLSGTDDEDSDSLETPHGRRYGRPVIASRRRSPSARSTSSRISTSAKYDYNEDTDSGIRYSRKLNFFFLHCLLTIFHKDFMLLGSLMSPFFMSLHMSCFDCGLR